MPASAGAGALSARPGAGSFIVPCPPAGLRGVCFRGGHARGRRRGLADAGGSEPLAPAAWRGAASAPDTRIPPACRRVAGRAALLPGCTLAPGAGISGRHRCRAGCPAARLYGGVPHECLAAAMDRVLQYGAEDGPSGAAGNTPSAVRLRHASGTLARRAPRLPRCTACPSRAALSPAPAGRRYRRKAAPGRPAGREARGGAGPAWADAPGVGCRPLRPPRKRHIGRAAAAPRWRWTGRP